MSDTKSNVKAVALSCSSCGGRLQIKPGMDELACGYCGATLMVERDGGSISLRILHTAISRVQVGTDKTAAELAINRLKGELATVESELGQVRWAMRKRKDGVFSAFATAGIILGAIGFCSLVRYSGLLAFFVGFGIAGGCVYLYYRNTSKIESEYQPRINQLVEHHHDLARQIDHHRNIVKL